VNGIVDFCGSLERKRRITFINTVKILNMKKFCSLLITVLCYSLMYSQCPQSTITLTTQAQVDNFSVNYPGCTEVLRDIRILDTPLSSTDPISNLTGLSPIISINWKSVALHQQTLADLKI